jgi:holliday junction DNA helicase RuvA
VGSQLLLYVYLLTRDTGPSLFGFRSQSQRQLFELLISLNGVGPKTALSLISHMSGPQLQEAVALGDAKAFKKIPGVGPKLAERLLVELRDKLSDLIDEEGVQPQGRLVHDALRALLQLGFSQSVAQKMLQEVTTQQPAISDLPSLLSAALRRSGSG